MSEKTWMRIKTGILVVLLISVLVGLFFLQRWANNVHDRALIEQTKKELREEK